MALIIKADMPKGCCWYDEEGHCIRCFRLLDCEQGTPYDAVRPSNCPIIVEIPNEHGRLKDESVIIEKMQDAFINNFCKDEERIVYGTLMKSVLNAPTVVEASR